MSRKRDRYDFILGVLALIILLASAVMAFHLLGLMIHWVASWW